MILAEKHVKAVKRGLRDHLICVLSCTVLYVLDDHAAIDTANGQELMMRVTFFI